MKKTEILQESQLNFPYNLESLPYEYNALEPFVDAQTMELHHTKHHNAYIQKANAALENDAANNKIPLVHLFDKVSELSPAIRNNGGGHFNHQFFWQILKANENGKPSGELMQHIDKSFGSFDNFREEFTNAALTRFGSGWAWLAIDDNNELFVSSTPNQDNPLMDIADKRGYPLIGLDVWEHAYYLKYQNRRPDYVKAFWNIVNWAEVEKRYQNLLK
ncbi:MAG: superoxide dismutase [Marinilabiliales bacterium]|nr:MAG: superoxide dismutase [Marinilabiliales bacterium]